MRAHFQQSLRYPFLTSIKENFEPVSRGQPHWSDVNRCVFKRYFDPKVIVSSRILLAHLSQFLKKKKKILTSIILAILRRWGLGWRILFWRVRGPRLERDGQFLRRWGSEFLEIAIMHSGLILKEKHCISKEFASIESIKPRDGIFFSTFCMLTSLELRYNFLLTSAFRQHSFNIGQLQDKLYIKMKNKEKGCFKGNYFASWTWTCRERLRSWNQKIDKWFAIVMRLFRTWYFTSRLLLAYYFISWH